MLKKIKRKLFFYYSKLKVQSKNSNNKKSNSDKIDNLKTSPIKKSNNIIHEKISSPQNLNSVDVFLEADIYSTKNAIQDEKIKFESKKNRLINKINYNIKELKTISEQLFENGFKEYYEKVIDLIEQSNSFARILKKLDTARPYAKEVMKSVKKQAVAVRGLIITLYNN